MSKSGKAGWFAGEAPSGLGVEQGRLKPCPDTPNCVNSQSRDRAAIAPLEVKGGAAATWSRLAGIVAAMPRVRIVERTERYLRAEFESRIFGFVDDVEFLLDADAGVIHARSASRMGYSDLGVNRRRIEDIRRRLGAEDRKA